MNYECKSIPISKLQVSQTGVMESLCEKCACRDCSNDVEWKKISIIGIEYRKRLILRGDEPGLVVECKGFIL
jgi:hypothetical protein